MTELRGRSTRDPLAEAERLLRWARAILAAAVVVLLAAVALIVLRLTGVLP